ncbi:MAG: TatD family hydrolase [Candidatus Paceibacterota bacterium]
MPRLIDTHAHLNFANYDGDRHQVIENTLEAGVSMINVGVNYTSSERAVELVKESTQGIWAAVGLHPQNIDDDLHPDAKDFIRTEDIKEPVFNVEAYRRLAQSSPKVVAIGEIGLDYLNLPKDEIKASAIRLKQQNVFRQQLDLAAELGLPAIIHSRTAHKDTIRILHQFAAAGGKINGVMHCFTGNAKEANQYYDLGLYFGLNGIIFKLNLDQAITKMPLARILLETDCPFLSPLPEVKRNEPRFVMEVAQRVAQIRNDSVETIIEAATANAEKLFGIG